MAHSSVRNLVLIGYRGSGKSSVGRALAARLGWTFVDTDTLIARRAGQTIREIFAALGERGFRDQESAVIQDVAKGDGTVIAAGGGAVLRAENVAALKGTGKIIYLRADAETLWERIRSDAQTAATRPNLTAQGGLEEVRSLLAIREPLYRAAADVTIDAAAVTPEQAAEQILETLGPFL